MLYPTNPTPEFALQNPLAQTITDAESIIAQIHQACDNLETCIADERTWHGRYRDALDNYEVGETEELSEIVILAQLKEGPLAGLATTSEAYKIALTHFKNSLRKGKLKSLWDIADRTRRSYENAQIDLQQAETRFAALRKIADIKANVLRAATI